MNEKLKCLQNKLKNKEAILHFTTEDEDPTLLWAVGMSAEYTFLLITKKECVLFVSSLERERAKKEANIKKVLTLKEGIEDLNKYLQKVSTIFLDYNKISINNFKRIKKKVKGRKSYKDCSKLFTEERMIKTKSEIKIIKKACKITAKIWKEMCNSFKTFKTEEDIKIYIEDKARKYASGPSFSTIVGSGKHGAIPHHTTTKQKLKKGFCVIDFGIKYKNYISDVTRTVYIGNPTKKEIEDYNKVLRANEESIKACKDDVPLNKIDKISRTEFNYNHSLGHGIGVEVHESPALAPRSKTKLKKGMCFTIEPGMYKKGMYGIRIEDDIYFDGKKAHVLTKDISKKLVVIN